MRTRARAGRASLTGLQKQKQRKLVGNWVHGEGSTGRIELDRFWLGWDVIENDFFPRSKKDDY